MSTCRTNQVTDPLTLLSDTFDELQITGVTFNELQAVSDTFQELELIQFSPSPARDMRFAGIALDHHELDDADLDGDGT